MQSQARESKEIINVSIKPLKVLDDSSRLIDVDPKKFIVRIIYKGFCKEEVILTIDQLNTILNKKEERWVLASVSGPGAFLYTMSGVVGYKIMELSEVLELFNANFRAKEPSKKIVYISISREDKTLLYEEQEDEHLDELMKKYKSNYSNKMFHTIYITYDDGSEQDEILPLFQLAAILRIEKGLSYMRGASDIFCLSLSAKDKAAFRKSDMQILDSSQVVALFNERYHLIHKMDMFKFFGSRQEGSAVAVEPGKSSDVVVEPGKDGAAAEPAAKRQKIN